MLIAFSYNIVNFLLPIGKTVLNIHSQEYDEMCKAADIVAQNTEKTDKISVCGNYDLIYVLSDRESSSMYSYQYPIIEHDSEIKNEYLNDILKLETEIIVTHNEDSIHAILEDILNKHYELIDTAGAFYVYKKLT